MWQALLAGGLLGGAAGGIFGGGKRTTGIGKLATQQIGAQRRFVEAGVQNFRDFFPQFLQALNANSPAYSTLESTLLSDVNDTARTARLEQAFQNRLGAQQASRGLTRSPSAALQSSFAGLQFGEQMRSQAIGNLFNFTQGISQPLAMSFMGLSSGGAMGSDFGLAQSMNAGMARQNRNQSIVSGMMSGLGMGAFFGGSGGGFGQMQRTGLNSWQLPSGGMVTM